MLWISKINASGGYTYFFEVDVVRLTLFLVLQFFPYPENMKFGVRVSAGNLGE
jgi:hypothetical protein